MQIDYLDNHQAKVSQLARWHFDEWGYLSPNETLEERTARLKRSCGQDEIPTVVVGLLGDSLCGSAMLVANDMESKHELTPWLAGVYVAPEYRRNGYGSALIDRIVQEAAALNVGTLYLYTPSAEEYYLKLGGRLWSVASIVVYLLQLCRCLLSPSVGNRKNGKRILLPVNSVASAATIK